MLEFALPRTGGRAGHARDDLEAHSTSGWQQATFHPGIRRPRRKTSLPPARNSRKPPGPSSSVLGSAPAGSAA